jgi:hypothetical protein
MIEVKYSAKLLFNVEKSSDIYGDFCAFSCKFYIQSALIAVIFYFFANFYFRFFLDFFNLQVGDAGNIIFHGILSVCLYQLLNHALVAEHTVSERSLKFKRWLVNRIGVHCSEGGSFHLFDYQFFAKKMSKEIPNSIPKLFDFLINFKKMRSKIKKEMLDIDISYKYILEKALTRHQILIRTKMASILVIAPLLIYELALLAKSLF